MNNVNDQSSHESSIDLGKIFRLILMQSKLLLSLIFGALIISFIFYFSSSKVYRVSSIIQVDGGIFGSQSGDIPIDFINGGGANSSNLDDLITLYDTRENVIQIIKDLLLNIREENEDKSIKEFISYINIINPKYNKKVFYVEALEDYYKISDENNAISNRFNYSEISFFNGLEISLNKPDVTNSKYKLSVINPELLVKKYQATIRLSIMNRQRYYTSRGGLIKVSFDSDNPNQGIKIISKANQIFIKKDLDVQNQKASRAIKFIDDRLDSIKEVLENDKLKLSEFQKNNNTLDVDIEVESIIQSLSEIEDNINNIDLDIAKMQTSYTKDNPIFQQTLNQKRLLEDQKIIIESKIRLLPLSQQRYIDLYRNVNISEELYKELLNRRLSLSIVEASTLGNIRVIDKPYRDYLVSPKISDIFYFMVFVSFLSLIIVIVRGIYFLSMTNPAEILDGGVKVPLLGIFPFLDDTENSNNQYEQSLESLLVNINILNKAGDKKIISISSPTKENGKSTTCFKLASKIASLGNKVLLIDADYKRGALHKEFDRSSITMEKIKEISKNNIENLKVSDSLYFIPRISKLSDTFRWVSGGGFQSLLENVLSDEFDYIIIDTAPILSVSDTSVILGMSDINMLLIRHKVSRFSELKHCLENIEQIGSSFDGLIYNAYQKPQGYFGYYNYYGNYQYQYYASKYLNDDYYYEKED